MLFYSATDIVSKSHQCGVLSHAGDDTPQSETPADGRYSSLYLRVLLKWGASLNTHSVQSVMTFRFMVFCLAAIYSGQSSQVLVIFSRNIVSILRESNRCNEFSESNSCID